MTFKVQSQTESDTQNGKHNNCYTSRNFYTLNGKAIGNIEGESSIYHSAPMANQIDTTVGKYMDAIKIPTHIFQIDLRETHMKYH